MSEFDSQNSDMTVNFRKHMVSFLVTFYTILSMAQLFEFPSCLKVERQQQFMKGAIKQRFEKKC